MPMFRYALIMFLSSLIQNRTVAPLEEWETSCQKLEEWEASCQLHVLTVSNWNNNITLDHLGFIGAINGALNVFLYEGIGEELNTFIFEVKLELIKKVDWTTSGNKKELGNNSNQCESSKQSYKQQPHIDGDEFVEFSRNFKLEWKKIEQHLDKLKSFDDIEHYRRRLNDLAESAMNGTAPIKGIITKNDIGMFDGAAFNVLVRLEHEKLDNTDFSCAELEKAVEQDKEMVSNAYQVKNADE
uniref:Uncharacterized protein n=1 Tax=Globodera pallida TaxID=36090 RepID=A0A183BJX0_GLOPA